MGKKGGSNRLKREAAPWFWPIHRKELHWALKPRPGPHPTRRCLPLTLIVREILGFAKTRREAKRIVSEGKITVDGKVRRDDLFPVGMMDVISIPEIEKHFRVLPCSDGLRLHPIGSEEAKFKLCRIEGKAVVKGGNIQLNMHDGRNLLIKVKDPQNPVEDVYNLFDTLKISLENQEILEHFKMAEGSFAIFTGGKNMGRYGNIISIERKAGSKKELSLVTIRDSNEETYQTTLNYVFVIGDEKPRISLPHVKEAL